MTASMTQNEANPCSVVRASEAALLDEVSCYYQQKLAAHGPTPKGVDWNGVESQETRFRELCRCLDWSQDFTVNDLGCGYGALVGYLERQGSNYRYFGWDIAPSMIQEANRLYGDNVHAKFSVGAIPQQIADYGLASGIFNVRQGRADAEWFGFILQTLDVLNKSSSKAFAFNCLTAYSDEDKKRDYLYYADPLALFDHCKRRFGRRVSLLHDYELYEFTIIVRKTS